MVVGSAFAEWFQKATGNVPHPYQEALAMADQLPELVELPTGAGKTAAVVLAWLWRRRHGGRERRPPRRLIYCLPMRVLVEQTRDAIRCWLERLEQTACIDLHVLMGGKSADDWGIRPEREAILVGTQDMLLSRALNRGYAAARSRWPIEFGLLNSTAQRLSIDNA
jgi:CRISPR-associated endonuclease/helicase Cas3